MRKISFLLILTCLSFSYAHAQSWALTGNAATSGNFLGTTNLVDLVFKRNNVQSGFIGDNSTSFGSYALNPSSTGTANTAIGASALAINTTGISNVATGASTLAQNTTGSQNTATGGFALASNTTGYQNTATGEGALIFNTTGTQNTATGDAALYANTIGISNMADGFLAMYNSTTGSQNSAAGVSALVSNTTGGNNVALGYLTLATNTTGSNNTAIGVYADVSANNLTNATAIGYNSKVSQSNSIVLGGTGSYAVNVGIGTTAPSAKLEVNGNAIIGSGITSFPAGYNLYVSGGILTEHLKVAVKNSTNWADYVFAKDYKLKPLAEVEAFVQKNQHLSGMPSSDDLVKDGGVDVTQMLSKQMEKIEELTLYIIEQNKKIETLEKAVKELQK